MTRPTLDSLHLHVLGLDKITPGARYDFGIDHFVYQIKDVKFQQMKRSII